MAQTTRLALFGPIFVTVGHPKPPVGARDTCYNFLTSFPFSLSILLSLSPPVEPPFLYLSFPSELSNTHAFLLLLAQPCAFLLFNKHSLKAMHFFTIKYFQVGYLFPSLDLNIL